MSRNLPLDAETVTLRLNRHVSNSTGCSELASAVTEPKLSSREKGQTE